MTLSCATNSCLSGYSHYRGTSGGLTEDQYAKVKDMSWELRIIYSKVISNSEITAINQEAPTIGALLQQLNSLPLDKIKLFHLAHADCLYTNILIDRSPFGDGNYCRYSNSRKIAVIENLALGTDEDIEEALRMMVKDIEKYCRPNKDLNEKRATTRKNKLIEFLQVPAQEFYDATRRLYDNTSRRLLAQLLLFSAASMGMYFLAGIAGAIVATVGVVQVINILVQYSKFLSANHTSHQYLEATLSASASAKLR
jgi:hypothetical protein